MTRTNYIIKSQTGEDVRTVFTASTKREIEKLFNRLMRGFRKEGSYSVEIIRLGYAKATFFGRYGISETEYWVERA